MAPWTVLGGTVHSATDGPGGTICSYPWMVRGDQLLGDHPCVTEAVPSSFMTILTRIPP